MHPHTPAGRLGNAERWMQAASVNHLDIFVCYLIMSTIMSMRRNDFIGLA
jgi:hypothetical protein